MDQNQELVQSKRVLEFLTVANEFCLLVEECSEHPQKHLLEYFQRILPLLFIKGSLLPDIDPSDPEQHERYVTEEQWETRFNALRAVFDSNDSYWSIAHPSDQIPQPDKSSLAEDLADLYQDMKDFVLLYQKPLTSARENAVSACKLFFEEHWGKKALLASYIIHQINYPCCSDHHEH